MARGQREGLEGRILTPPTRYEPGTGATDACVHCRRPWEQHMLLIQGGWCPATSLQAEANARLHART